MQKFRDEPMPLAGATAAEEIERDDALAVLRLRYWQHLLNEMLKQKQFTIPIHLDFGHEAAAVALDRCMGPHDTLCLTHRNCAYNLIRAKSLDPILSHYRLAQSQNWPGLMGSMNLASVGTSIGYTSSILGNNLPVAAGIAMNRTLTTAPGVVFVLTGDGAMEEGSFWETLVFARSHSLPLVIIVENDNHSMSSTIAQRRAAIDVAKVCAGVGVHYASAMGADLAKTKRALAEARAQAAERGPACVELQLKTFNQHAGPTPGWPDDPMRIALEDGLILKSMPEDPVHLIQTSLGAQEFERLADQVLKAEGHDGKLH